MKMHNARQIISTGDRSPEGYIVSFDIVEPISGGRAVKGDHFPDTRAGEPPIKTIFEAWALAKGFAEKTRGKCINIQVADLHINPLEGYETLNPDPWPASIA